MFRKLNSLLLILLLWATSAFAVDLPTLLAIDRLHYYLTELSYVVERRGNPEIGAELRKISPEDILAANLPPAQLRDALEYDALARKLLQAKGIAAPSDVVVWEYPFFKRKLNEGYVLAAVSAAAAATAPNGAGSPPAELRAVPSSIQPEDLTLDAGHYISNRTSRAVFWDVIENHVDVEFHLGTARDFQRHLERSGGKVVGSVKTLARNYNPIHLVQYPGETQYRIAFTEISGGDRLDHLVRQVSLSRWKGQNGSQIRPKVKVYGDVTAKLLADERMITRQLLALPKADRVIIGQKGAVERAARTGAKARALLELRERAPAKVASLVDQAESRLLTNGASYVSDFMTFKDAAKWDKLYEKLGPLLAENHLSAAGGFVSISIANPSHDIEDYLFVDAQGAERRLRVISNTWGDEVSPVVKALRNTGHREIFYLGTAGAFPHKGLDVGDLVIPRFVQGTNGQIYTVTAPAELPATADPQSRTVTHVGTPYQESHAWLASAQANADVVEIETSYLAEAMNTPGDRLTVYLLVSDVVGSHGETLAQAESSSRRGAQVAALNSVFEQAGIRSVSNGHAGTPSLGKVEKLVDETFASKDLAWRYQVGQLYKSKNGAVAVATLAAGSKPFTTSFLEDRLNRAQGALERALAGIDSGEFRIHVSKSLVQGVFHPKSDPLVVYLEALSAARATSIQAKIADLYAQDSTLKKIVTLKAGHGPPGADPTVVAIPRAWSGTDDLLRIYGDSALRNGGVSLGFTTSGKAKLTRMPTRTTLHHETLLDPADVATNWVTTEPPALATCADFFHP